MYFKEKDFLDLKDFISEEYNIYAHLSEDKKKKETLTEHTMLAISYFKNLAKPLDSVFLSFENKYLSKVSEEAKDLFRQLTANTVMMHDIGKINPLFQSRKMDNNLNLAYENFNCIETKHSILSAVLYIDYFLDKVKAFDKTERNILRTIMFVNAYIISKHHGNLDEFRDFLDDFYDGNSSTLIGMLDDNPYKVCKKKFTLNNKKIENQAGYTLKFLRKVSAGNNNQQQTFLYIYSKLMYSLLVASDFYATTQFMNAAEVNDFGHINDIEEFYDVYKDTAVYKSIRKYEREYYGKVNDFTNEKDINVLRNEMFLDAERELLKSINESIFFLEAPTGSGKSNVAMNLSFKLMEQDNRLNKIFYVYPFNTLVEQNLNTIKQIFKDKEDVLKKIAVINSISPIKMDEKAIAECAKEEENKYYYKALLNREFLNYPIVLTTHVSLFKTMFNASKEDSFAFHQLANSVIVLDEIQSYKNSIWAEIIIFLKAFASVLNIKVIIMSATLPDLNVLTNSSENTVHLIKNREKYFLNPLFKDRVKIDYELLDSDDIDEELQEHVLKNSNRKKKILIEFIKKKSAYEFYNTIRDEACCRVELMTGDDNSIEREKILNIVKDSKTAEEGIILTATQVIEAGVDIDMDIGYKDISILDSDEQFMGRVNRSCRRSGEVYFFDKDEAKTIYKNDVRKDKSLSLKNDDMKSVLINKEFNKYYNLVIDRLKQQFNEAINDANLNDFFSDKVEILNYKSIEERMKLIEDDSWSMSIYFSRTIEKEDGTSLDGGELWNKYRDLLKNNSMDYAKKEVELSKVRSKMNYFVYEFEKLDSFTYTDRIGELYFIEDGYKFFDEGKLNRERFIKGIGDFI